MADIGADRVTLIALMVWVFRYKHHTFLSYAASTLIVAGGIGNMIDRVAFGYVELMGLLMSKH